MAGIKRIGVYVLFGVLLGAVGGTVVAPGVLTFYRAPLATSEGLCQCMDVVRSTTQNVVMVQGIGAAIGALVFLIIALVTSVMHRGRGRPVARPVIAEPAPKPG